VTALAATPGPGYNKGKPLFQESPVSKKRSVKTPTRTSVVPW
jgi:hypothetical protein